MSEIKVNKDKQKKRVQDLVGLVHRLYDPDLAEEWDNVGLQAGDPAAELKRVMVALDPTLAALQAARDAGAQALLTHHPLLFRPIKKLSPEDAVGQVLWLAARSGVAIVSAHTNLDSATNGLNDWLAAQLGLRKHAPLQTIVGNYLKLVVFVPQDHQQAVAEALFSAGAGQIGAYDQCSFRSLGTGTFRPGLETNPYIGEAGKAQDVEEIRLETIVPKRKLSRVLEKMLKTHPYEEAAYDLIPLQNQLPGAGLGRIGRLDETVSLDDFAIQVKECLGCDHVRVAGSNIQKVSKVALCGGSGAGLLHTARRQGADVLVTGDVKYHDARLAEELGIALIDAGHFATEKIMIKQLAEIMQVVARQENWQVTFETYTGEQEPFRLY